MPLIKDNQREDILIAYLAGLIDGEGSIMIVKHKESWGYKYQICISFVNTNRKVVEMVSKFLGNQTIFEHEPGQYGFKGNYTCYKCKVTGTVKVLEPLKKLLPYLVIKKDLAELAIYFCENRKASKPTKTQKGKHRITPEEAQWRENIYQKYKSIVHPQRLNEKTPKGEAIV